MLFLLALTGCGGGAQLQVRGATFDLSGKEADIAQQYEHEEPRTAPAADRCNYWKKRVGDAQGGHTIGVLNWPAEYFEHLRSWVAAKRDEACAVPGADQATAAARQAPSPTPSAPTPSGTTGQVTVENDASGVTIVIQCTDGGTPMANAQAILAPQMSFRSRPPGRFLALTTGADGKSTVSAADARKVIYAGGWQERGGQVIPDNFVVACVRSDQPIASCAQPNCFQAPPAMTSFVTNDAPAMQQVYLDWVADERAGRSAEQAVKLRTDATALVAAHNFMDARPLVRRCLALSAGDAVCLALQTKLDAAAADTTRKLVAAHRVFDAQYEVGRCLAANPADPVCTKLKPTVDAAAAQLQPDHVKDVALYEEGGGVMFYFSLVNSAQTYVPADGKVSVFVAFEKDGLVINRVPVGSAPFDVGSSAFAQRTIGVGALSRNALLWSKLIAANDAYANFSPVPGMGRAALHQLAEDADRVYVEAKFVDGSGHVFTGRDTFTP